MGGGGRLPDEVAKLKALAGVQLPVVALVGYMVDSAGERRGGGVIQ